MTLCADDDPIAHIVKHLRAKDIEELSECGWSPDRVYSVFLSEPILGCIWHDVAGAPAAVCVFHALTPKALQVSLVSTDNWEEVATRVYRWGVKVARPKLIALGYARAECRTIEGHADAIRLLEHFGFVLEARIPRYGKTGRAFLQYAWRMEDHAVNGAAVIEQLLPQCAGGGAREDETISAVGTRRRLGGETTKASRR